MSYLYCPECNSYLEGGSGELQDCSCGFKQSAPDPETEYYGWQIDINEEEGTRYYTACDEEFSLGSGNLEDNKIKFCLYCGGEINLI